MFSDVVAVGVRYVDQLSGNPKIASRVSFGVWGKGI